MPLSAQSADSIINRYIQTSGGMATIQAIQTLRRTGKFMGSGGFEAVVVQENKRPNNVREEFSLLAPLGAYFLSSLQGGVTAGSGACVLAFGAASGARSSPAQVTIMRGTKARSLCSA